MQIRHGNTKLCNGRQPKARKDIARKSKAKEGKATQIRANEEKVRQGQPAVCGSGGMPPDALGYFIIFKWHFMDT